MNLCERKNDQDFSKNKKAFLNYEKFLLDSQRVLRQKEMKNIFSHFLFGIVHKGRVIIARLRVQLLRKVSHKIWNQYLIFLRSFIFNLALKEEGSLSKKLQK